MGAEGAKVLRQLGSKVERMEKLSTSDILLEVHEAAEQLQMKIDSHSFLLVNSENWEAVRQQSKENEQPDNLIDVRDNENKQSAGITPSNESESDDYSKLNITIERSMPESSFSQIMNKSLASWPHLSFCTDAIVNEPESKVYESASSLSLATFTSLLIEFVARLQNLVDEFQDLSEKANFKDPYDQPMLK